MQETYDYFEEHGMEDAVILTDYCNALIGLSSDGRAIYSFTLMAEHLMVDEGMDYHQAIETIDENTINALPYMGEKAPIIMYDIDDA